MYLEEEVIEREPLGSEGVTGAPLQRLVLGDGRVLVEKTISARLDWLMRATGDDGRVHRLWQAGLFDRLPPTIDSAIVDVRERPDGWTVLMHDVSHTLRPVGQRFSRQQSRQIMAAVADLHHSFVDPSIEGLCSVVERISFLAPSAIQGLPDHPLSEIGSRGWERFVELVPADVGNAVVALWDRPGGLASVLGQHPVTILHGDLKAANIGLDGSTVVLLDWGTLTGVGPAALDLAWYLATNSAAVDASLDELLADATQVLSPDDRAALPLALLSQVLLLGWEKALGATSDDPTTRDREQDGLAWWCQRAAEALELWSPV